jgi:aminopeptidase N
LDGRGLNIGRVFSTAGPIEYETGASDPILGERISTMLGEPTDAFTIELATAPDAKALQWLDANKTAGGRQPFLYSQCQPIHARSVFPCQDSPSVRFTYTAQLEVPKGLTAVMAAEHIGTDTQGDTDIYSFRMPQPIPSA